MAKVKQNKSNITKSDNQVSPREQAKARFIESGGKIKTRENARLSGVSESQIRKWKSMDDWAEALGSRGEHGGVGNANAVGNGAPKRNQNAVTHGSYKTMHLDDLSPDCRAYVAEIDGDSEQNLLRELQLLYAKEYDLKAKIKRLEAEPEPTLHVFVSFFCITKNLFIIVMQTTRIYVYAIVFDFKNKSFFFVKTLAPITR